MMNHVIDKKNYMHNWPKIKNLEQPPEFKNMGAVIGKQSVMGWHDALSSDYFPMASHSNLPTVKFIFNLYFSVLK